MAGNKRTNGPAEGALTRSEMMSRVRGRDTTPEMRVRSVAHRLGLRFRIHRKDLPGTPDLVFPRHRLVVFVHGCFWHRHEGCNRASVPKTRVVFWSTKFENNVERDARNHRALEASGWRVAVIWECETTNPAILKGKVQALFT